MPTATSELIIEARGLVKRYGDFTAVDHLDLEVKSGEIFGILGPNGAGKTTTLEMIEGLRKPDEGSIIVAGIDAVADADAVRRVIGVQLQTTALFPFLSAAELIELFAWLYDVDASPGPDRSNCSAMVDLSDKRDNRGRPALRRAAAAALDHPGPGQQSQSRLSRRTDHRARSGRAARSLENRAGRARGGRDRGADHALYGRSRSALRPGRGHERGQDHRPRHAGGR